MFEANQHVRLRYKQHKRQHDHHDYRRQDIACTEAPSEHDRASRVHPERTLTSAGESRLPVHSGWVGVTVFAASPRLRAAKSLAPLYVWLERPIRSGVRSESRAKHVPNTATHSFKFFHRACRYSTLASRR